MKRFQMSESLPVAFLLACSGGILDAYTYLNRGHVFATAETGNLVLLGMSLAQGEFGRVLFYLCPILAYAVGVLATEYIRRQLSQHRQILYWRQTVLLIECLVFLLVAFVPQGRPDPVTNMLVAFASAMQVESFRQFRGCPCATTMCTGNLRSGTASLFLRIWEKDPEAGRKSRFYYGLILCFVLGTCISGLASPLFAGKTILLALIPHLIAFSLMFFPVHHTEA